MKPHSLFVAALCSLIPLSIALAGDDCPWMSSEWEIFPDSTPGAPDFWWKTDPVDVRAICVCDHGVQLQFDVTEKGKNRRAALVFPNPLRSLLAERLIPKLEGEALDAEVEHCRARYEALLSGLEKVSGGALRGKGCLHYEPGGEVEPPTLVAAFQLALYWNEDSLRLRGYLDVYFRRGPVPTRIAGVVGGRGPLMEYAGLVEGVSLAPSLDIASDPRLRILPNPGGRGDYRISFGLPAPGRVELEVYNVAGRRVATLLSGPAVAGDRRLNWSGRGSAGQRIGSGVYFVRLATIRGAQARKFIHLGAE